MRRILTLLLLATALAACGSGSSSDGTPAPGGTETGQEQGLAPNFSFDLADGSTFVLAESTQPTYLVFWAEW